MMLYRDSRPRLRRIFFISRGAAAHEARRCRRREAVLTLRLLALIGFSPEFQHENFAD